MRNGSIAEMTSAVNIGSGGTSISTTEIGIEIEIGIRIGGEGKTGNRDRH